MAKSRTLIILLRVFGVLGCTAVFTIFMPTSWMATTHEWLGLGEFPDTPITQYLARSVSAFYAMFGGLAIIVSMDVKRYGPLIVYLAYATMAFGAVLTGIDAMAGLPTIIMGAVILLLVRRVNKAADSG